MYQILGAINGTGTDGEQYKKNFENSHVKKISESGKFNSSYYARGPLWHGESTQSRANLAAMQVKTQYEFQMRMHKISEEHKTDKGSTLYNPKPIIYLTGYSRGAAAVIDVCNQLKSADIPVYCLMLFDAVDRSSLSNVDVIPDNVKFAFHARRDPKAQSRESFSNCGTRAAPGVTYKEKYFFCTHGGVGGTPWTKETAGSGEYIFEIPEEAKYSTPIAYGISPVIGSAARYIVKVHGDTKVTVEQDGKGSDESWNWMQESLNSVNHIAPFIG